MSMPDDSATRVENRSRNSSRRYRSITVSKITGFGRAWSRSWPAEFQPQLFREHPALLANMLAVCAASGLPAEIVLGFVDAEVKRLLDLDTRREVSLCLVPIGRTSESPLPSPREAPVLGLETIPPSENEVSYPAMFEMHDASSLESEEEAAQWRGKQSIFPSSALPGAGCPFSGTIAKAIAAMDFFTGRL
jgi:hypothetical protein